MITPRCPRCPQQALEARSEGAALLHHCPRCAGVYCPAQTLGQLLGSGAERLGLSGGGTGALGSCPSGDGGALRACLPERIDDCGRCERCGALFVRLEGLQALRRLFAPRKSLPSLPAQPPPAAREEAILAEARVGYGNPWIDLLALPVSLVLSGLLSLSWFGRLLLFPVQIQFHELGHALPAWLSGRAALPLPFGFTFWREEQSLLTTLLVLGLAGLLAFKGVHERRPFAVLLGAALGLGAVSLSWLVSAERSRMVMIAGGGAGELMLSSLLLVSFYFPLPDRLRWDFFRFLALLPAAGALCASLRMWLAVRDGTQSMPMGSILGREGSGDLERLVAEYGFSSAELGALYLRISVLSCLLVATVYGVFALRALRSLLTRTPDA